MSGNPHAQTCAKSRRSLTSSTRDNGNYASGTKGNRAGLNTLRPPGYKDCSSPRGSVSSATSAARSVLLDNLEAAALFDDDLDLGY